jgi:hypothetical protein
VARKWLGDWLKKWPRDELAGEAHFALGEDPGAGMAGAGGIGREGTGGGVVDQEQFPRGRRQGLPTKAPQGAGEEVGARVVGADDNAEE